MAILPAMSFQERRVSGGGGMMDQLTPVVKWLLIANIAIYFSDLLIFDKWMQDHFAFTIQSGIHERKIWQFLTFQFIHAGVPHVLFNSMGLFFFGPWMERWWGAKKFLLFYLACGAAGAMFYSVLVTAGILPQSYAEILPDGSRQIVPAVWVPLVGASAGIYGILVGVAVIAPSLRVALFFPPVTLTMRQMALVLLAIAVGSIALKLGGNEGGEAGHLGGAIMGYFLMKLPALMGGSGGSRQERRGRPLSDYGAKMRPRTSLDLHSSTEVDRILEKISREGFQSITEEEREVLRRAAGNGDGL